MLQSFRLPFGRSNRRALVASVMFIAVIYAWVAPGFVYSFRQADQFADVVRAPWGAANTWIKAAACTYRTGKLLVGCQKDDVVVPYATAFHADDPGHAILLGAWSLLADRPVVLTDISRLNTILNYIGLLIVAGGLFLTGSRIIPSLFLIFAVPVVNAWHALSPHPALYGVACMAALPSFIILARLRRNIVNPFALSVLFLIAFLFLVAALLLRQAVGMMGVLAAILVGCYWIWMAKRRRERILAPIAAVILSVVLLGAPTALLKARDLAYGLEHSTNMEQHGISHPLFLGLGAVKNSFGIRWRDEYGYERAREINPDIYIWSKEYYDIMWKLYLDTVISNPAEMIRVYWNKFKIALKTENQGFSPVQLWKVLLSAVILNGLSYWLFRREFWGGDALPAILVSTIFLSCFLAQAAIIHPSPQFTSPVFLFAFLLLVAPLPGLIEIAGRTASPLGRPHE